MAQMGYTMPGMGGRGYGSSSLGKRRVKSEEEYFEGDDEEDQDGLEYQPAPGSPSLDKDKSQEDDDEDDEDDPLEAFMAGIEKEVKQQEKVTKGKGKKKGIRDDIDNEDDQESYFRYMEENPLAGVVLEEEDELEYDADGNPIIPEHKRIIDPLPPIDHSEFKYEPFNKNFYEAHEEITKMTPEQVKELRRRQDIHISGILPPYPVSSFAHFGFDDQLLKAIIKAGYTVPTPIQAQGVPVALSGRDVIGIAKTGSGKTAAYLWPMLRHIMDQKELEKGDGPIGLILAPTRELAQQIYAECKKFGKVYNVNVVCAYGGGNMYEQCKACEEGAEIIVATPGRLIDLVKKKATNLQRVTMLVYDEADRMFDMGFEPQVRSIAGHVRPDRQTLLFSATFKKKVERLARDILTDPIRIIQGELGEANTDITQTVKVFSQGTDKWKWLMGRLVEFTSVGSVLIFVTKKTNSEELATNLQAQDFKLGLLHGDMDQTERNTIITAFKKKEIPILVATDVAARGLDIPSIKTVINYDVARDIDTHTHRIGRTGRAGEKGFAFTLVTAKDKDFAGHLVRNLEGANQYVPQELLDLAMHNPWFKKSRYRHQKAKRMNTGEGLGFRERPGLGSSDNTVGGGSSNAGQASARSFTHYQPSGSSGPQSDRVSAVKSAFMAQFKSNFVQATEHASQQTSQSIEPETDGPTAPSAYEDAAKRRKRSRWD